ncbi:MAG: FAD:protein FMN transferase, partial [Beijerinckiaceae bacterium]|nr:FAD:protein FMN transferase [Beijerinckiaceae bacterium]
MPPACDNIRRLRPLLGTFVEVAVAGAAVADMEAAVEAAFAAIGTVHRLMSFHDEASDVSRLNHGAFEAATGVHSWTFQVLEAALESEALRAGQRALDKEKEIYQEILTRLI